VWTGITADLVQAGPFYPLGTTGTVPRAYEPYRGLCKSENEQFTK